MNPIDLALIKKLKRECLEEARAIIPERGAKGDRGEKGIKGDAGKNGKHGANGKNGRDGKDGANGKDGTDGINANRWHLTFGEPDVDFGGDDDFALDGESSNVWHKDKGEWEFVTHLKAEVPMMQAPRAYSPEQIRDISGGVPSVRYTATDTTTTDDDEVIVATGLATVTLHTPTSTEPLKAKRIKRVGLSPVTVTDVDTTGYILNVNYQAVDVQWTGTEWISL